MCGSCGRRLRERNPNVRLVAAEPHPGAQLQGLRSLGEGYVPPILDLDILDAKILVNSGCAFRAVREVLAREGLMVGPSSGAAMHAALKWAQRLDQGNVVVMFADSLRGDGALGMLVALGVPLAFAANLIVVRHHAGQADMVPTVVIAGVISAAVALPAALPLTASVHDIAVLAVMGTVQLGIGCMLMTLATRDLAAAEVGLLALLETTLGPVWVWLGMGERPSDLALLGGVAVIGALAINGLYGLVQDRRAAAVR